LKPHTSFTLPEDEEPPNWHVSKFMVSIREVPRKFCLQWNVSTLICVFVWQVHTQARNFVQDNFMIVWPCIVRDSLWIKPTDAPNSNFIGITTLHVSGSLSAHHQEFLTVHWLLAHFIQLWWPSATRSRMELLCDFIQPFLPWKTITITYSECMFVDLGIYHAKCMCHTVICGLPGSTIFVHIIS